MPASLNVSLAASSDPSANSSPLADKTTISSSEDGANSGRVSRGGSKIKQWFSKVLTKLHLKGRDEEQTDQDDDDSEDIDMTTVGLQTTDATATVAFEDDIAELQIELVDGDEDIFGISSEQPSSMLKAFHCANTSSGIDGFELEPV